MFEVCSFHFDESSGVCYRYLGFLGIPHHRVGDDGSVWSRWKRDRYREAIAPWHRLRGMDPKNHSGYARYRLRSGCGRVDVHGHTLVLLAFVGPRPEGMECCHGNGIRHDNRLENLRWDTHQGNMADRLRHGTDSRGERCGLAILSEADVRWLKGEWARRYGTMSCRAFCREQSPRFGVHPGTIRGMLRGLTWKHI